MLKVFLCLALIITLNIVYVPFSYALDNYEVKKFLKSREESWPNWVSSHLKFSNIKKDLYYPSWFYGDWIVTSEDLKYSSDKKIIYNVNFLKNESGDIVGNRSKNAESIGKSIFGDRLIKVKTDPKSFNNQITYLSNNEYIESRVIERNQFFDNDLFFADEFFIQILHKPDLLRINQVEIMSRFYKCNKNNSSFNEAGKDDICGYQYLATYGSKVGEKNIKPITQSKYKLTFKYLGKKH